MVARFASFNASAQGLHGGRPSLIGFLAVLLWAALIVPAGTFSIQPLDRDESRFMQATTQMLETGDYLSIRYQERERNKKPAGIYWLQAASVSAFSNVEARAPWAYRLPSMLAGILSVLLLYLVGCRLFGEAAGFWAAVLLAAGPTFAGEASIAKTDAALTTCVIAAQGALAVIFLRHLAGRPVGWPWPVTFWLALAAGIMIKGPIAPMISFLTIGTLGLWLLAQKRNPIAFGFACRPFTGAAILTVAVVPWAIAIGMATEGRFFTEALGTDMLGKAIEVQESHDGFFGYYIRAVWVFFWPAGLFIPLALYQAFRLWRDPAAAFCLAWLIPGWLVFEIASTKLTHYTLPFYPALALLCAAALQFMASHKDTLTERIYRWAGILAYLASSAVVVAALIWLSRNFDRHAVTAFDWSIIVSISAGALAAVIFFILHRHAAAIGMASLASAILCWGLFEGMIPHFEELRLSPRLADTLYEQGLHPRLQGAPPVALLGYNEPSAVFLLGTDTINAKTSEVVDWLRAAPGHVAVVDTENHEAFLTELGKTPVTVIGELDGFNYSNNNATTLTIYRSDPVN